MNRNWRNRPTTIDYITNDIDVIISIDESGNSSLKNVIDTKNRGLKAIISEKYFTVTASVICMKDFTCARDMIMDLKQKYWADALFCYNENRKRVCFHSREIRNQQNAFNPCVINYKDFINDLSNLMFNIPIKIYASHIDKERHVNQYVNPISPYELCMNFIIERIMRDLILNEKCIIILESRGKKEDKLLLDQIKNLVDHGNNYHNAKEFSRIKGVYFNPKWCKIADEKMSYWELELSDLCAFPIHKYFCYGKKDAAFDIIEKKISHFPYHHGKGLKSFP